MQSARLRPRLSPTKAIRAFCLECMGGSRKEVAGCESRGCPLRPYRFGKNPARAGIGGRPGPKDKGQKLKAVASAPN